MVCNWKIPFESNMRKLELMKVWGVQAADCWFDNQLSPNIMPKFWIKTEIKEFRKRYRKHNQLIAFGIDPEYKSDEKQISMPL